MERIKLRGVNVILAALAICISFSTNALTAKQAGQKGMDYITQAAVEWQRQRGCFACHTQGMTVWGASIGSARGYNVNQNQLAELVANVKSAQGGNDLWAHNGHAPTMVTAIATSGLAYYDRSVTTDAQETFIRGADKLLSLQKADGRWVSDGLWKSDAREIFRFDSNHSVTAMSIITMRHAFELTKAPIYKDAYTKAALWLKGIFPSDTQSLAYKMMGLVEAQLPVEDPAIQDTIQRLLDRQNGDGGFGVYPGKNSSAYQTGVAIYALRLAGLSSADPKVSEGIGWLLSHQNSDGSWPIGAARLDYSDRVAPNMWPVIALGEYGELGVTVKATPEAQEMLAYSDTEQTITYTFTITNSGHSDQPDTFDIQLSGGYPGFNASLSDSLVTLASGESRDITLTMIAPANLPYGFPVTHSLTATSQANADTFAISSVTSATPPPPPSIGHNTNITMIAGANTSMSTDQTATFAVRVIDTVTNQYVYGGSSAVVNFFVGGVSIGGDSDADGDGIFEINWTPGWDWTKLGTQSLLVTYSGIDHPAPMDDLLFSFYFTDINIEAPVVTTRTIIENSIVDIDLILSTLPSKDLMKSIKSISNQFEQAQDHLSAGIAAYAAGDNTTALDEFNTALDKLRLAIDQLNKDSCANKKGKNTCIDDSLVDLIIGQTNAVITDIELAIALMNQ